MVSSQIECWNFPRDFAARALNLSLCGSSAKTNALTRNILSAKQASWRSKFNLKYSIFVQFKNLVQRFKAHGYFRHIKRSRILSLLKK